MSVVVAFIAALIALYIGLMQWRTAHYRLSFDLYEKRYKVYEAIKDLINKANANEEVIAEDLKAFYDGIRGAEFLFDGETRNFILKIGQMAWSAQMARAQLERHQERQLERPNQPFVDHPRADKLFEKEEEMLDFLATQGQMLEEKFRPYLDLSKAGLKSYWPW